MVPPNGALGQVGEWKLKDFIVIHKLLQTILVDQDAALRWKERCAEYFMYSTYFEGEDSSVMPNSVYNLVSRNTENGSANHFEGKQITDAIASNGKLEGFKDLTI